jgi:hypothetical protein
MNTLELVRGVQQIERNDLALIPVPEASPTYTPVPHFDLARSLTTIAQDMLRGFELSSERFEVARLGNQMFATLSFSNSDANMKLTVGFRNSYDKSLALGIAIGSQVIVCSNLMFVGDITVLKRHSKNILSSLENTAINVLYKAQFTYDKLTRDSQKMKQIEIDDHQAFQKLGLLFGRDILSARQLPAAKKEWLVPQHDEFKPRNLYSLYNACTAALKSAAPAYIMEKHIALHKQLNGS